MLGWMSCCFEQRAVVDAGILHAAIGVMDQAARRGLARLDRHVERCDRQTRLADVVQGPADDAAAEGIEDNGKKDELLVQPDIGDVGHPELIETGRHHAARQVRHHAPSVTQSRS